MSKDQDNFLTDEDIEWEKRYFNLIAELSKQNDSRYEVLANNLIDGGQELLEVKGEVFKISVDKKGCSWGCSEDNGATFQELGWVKLSRKKDARILIIKDAIARCEARAIINA